MNWKTFVLFCAVTLIVGVSVVVTFVEAGTRTIENLSSGEVRQQATGNNTMALTVDPGKAWKFKYAYVKVEEGELSEGEIVYVHRDSTGMPGVDGTIAGINLASENPSRVTFIEPYIFGPDDSLTFYMENTNNNTWALEVIYEQWQ